MLLLVFMIGIFVFTTNVFAKSKNAIFRIDADFSLFDGKLYIDGILVDAKNYKAESGSTVITLNKECVDTLSVGEHTIKVEFSDNGSASTSNTFFPRFANATPKLKVVVVLPTPPFLVCNSIYLTIIHFFSPFLIF